MSTTEDREAPSESRHRAPCFEGSVCGESAHCPPVDPMEALSALYNAEEGSREKDAAWEVLAAHIRTAARPSPVDVEREAMAPDVEASLRRWLDQSARGETVDLGDFTRYAPVDVDAVAAVRDALRCIDAAELEADVARLAGLRAFADTVAAVTPCACSAQRSRAQDAETKIAAVEAALAGHPECDVHPDADPISCGWKRAVHDARAALSTPEPVTVSAEQVEAADTRDDLDALPVGSVVRDPHGMVWTKRLALIDGDPVARWFAAGVLGDFDCCARPARVLYRPDAEPVTVVDCMTGPDEGVGA